MANSPKDGDYYIIINVASNSCLDLNNGDKGNGTGVQGWGQDFGSSPVKAQIWKTTRESSSSEYYQLINKASGTVLDLDNGDKGNGTKVQGWGSANVENQFWKFDKIAGGLGGSDVPALFW